MENEKLYPELLDYIFDYHPGFMYENEQKAWRHQLAVQRIEFGNRINFHKHRHEQEHVSKVEKVLKLMEGGYDNYKTITATRIYIEHKNELQFNLCPKCNKVARTPWAKQCRFCFHDWH